MDNEPKILIVDDDTSAIQVLRNAIQGMGRISFATGGRVGSLHDPKAQHPDRVRAKLHG